MAINYSYPEIETLASSDLFIVTDISQDNATKSIKASSISGYVKGTFPEYNDNAGALAGGLPVGSFYRTGDVVKVVH